MPQAMVTMQATLATLLSRFSFRLADQACLPRSVLSSCTHHKLAVLTLCSTALRHTQHSGHMPIRRLERH